jgi:membrane-bound metal-dependent hydrolase YbcI (DUF457 family)
MDPLSHAALGRTLAAVSPGTAAGRATAVAGTLAALAPDLDAVVMPFGWDRYLRVHEIGTHSLLGSVGCALLTAAVVRAFAPGARWRALLPAAIAGAASHILLDLLSSARLRIFWPVLDAQVSVPLVAMADPWLAAILVAGAAALWLVRAPERRTASLALAAGTTFLIVKGALGLVAIDAYRRAEGGRPGTSAIVEARWAALTEWHVFDRTPAALRYWRSYGDGGGARLVLAWPLQAESPAIRASRALSAVQNFLRVHPLAFAVSLPGPGGEERVLWSDIRYCWDPSGAGSPQLEPKVVVNGQSISCALWFGGEFDRTGRALQQLVKIGGFTQTRLPER